MIFCRGGLFLHQQKTGGTSITEALCKTGEAFYLAPIKDYEFSDDSLQGPACVRANYYGPHNYPNQLAQAMGTAWAAAWTFTVVRNPWERYVSMYWWHVKERQRTGRSLQEDFEQFTRRRVESAIRDHDASIKPQTRFLSAVRFNYVLRYERLEEDWKAVRRRLGVGPLERRTASARPVVWWDQYEDCSYLVDEIAKLERWLIETYGYDFPGER